MSDLLVILLCIAVLAGCYKALAVLARLFDEMDNT